MRNDRRNVLLAAAGLWLPAGAFAHGVRAGDLLIDHPYATPSLAGARQGAAYLRGVRNQGDAADRLIGAHTPVAARVALHHMRLDGGVMRMREVSFIELPARSEVRMGHGGAWHLMLEDLKQPLKDGDRFDLTLRFERAGERAVKVWVQTPRDATTHRH
jgi:hypothetical protein